MKKYVVLLLGVVIFLPVVSEARWRSIDTDRLDDDPVDSIPVPVLFAVDLDQVRPDFGDPRGGGTREQEGQDFIAPKGTPVVSPTEAIVTSVGTGASAGKFVYTVNPGGERFRYMHLDEIADIKRGDFLEVGDLIGTVGDTGNALAGSYHLHFETRDKNNRAQNPYDRLEAAFDLEATMEFLPNILRAVEDDEEYAAFLVEMFRAEFIEAVREDIELPRVVERAMDDAGIKDTVQQVEQLQAVIARIPQLLTGELKTGDTGAQVVLLQLYLMLSSEGTARDRLAAAGATGYYGGITQAAIEEYQATNKLPVTGRYDSATRADML